MKTLIAAGWILAIYSTIHGDYVTYFYPFFIGLGLLVFLTLIAYLNRPQVEQIDWSKPYKLESIQVPLFKQEPVMPWYHPLVTLFYETQYERDIQDYNNRMGSVNKAHIKQI